MFAGPNGSGKSELKTHLPPKLLGIYLYFIATDDPVINISRVRNREKLGGHSVPADKIETRYHRSLDLLMEGIMSTNRAYVFDNSGENIQHTWIAEILDGRTLTLKTDRIPSWFKRSVLDKINAPLS